MPCVECEVRAATIATLTAERDRLTRIASNLELKVAELSVERDALQAKLEAAERRAGEEAIAHLEAENSLLQLCQQERDALKAKLEVAVRALLKACGIVEGV